MKENPYLKSFVPKDQSEVELNTYLTEVAQRISTVIPPDDVFKLFSSTPNQTGGIAKFPFCRMDMTLIACNESIQRIEKINNENYFQRGFENASMYALKAVLWIEVGFEGLDNLADSPASINWTTDAGYFVNDRERANVIKATGREMYNETLRKFVQFRDSRGITEDIFTRYGVGNLLDRWKS